MTKKAVIKKAIVDTKLEERKKLPTLKDLKAEDNEFKDEAESLAKILTKRKQKKK